MADRFDWQQVYARLEQSRKALDAGGARPPDEVRRILRERAQALARPREEVRTPTEMLDLLVFALAGERYGIETAHIQEVIPLRELTPVPCTPALILGVVNHRGWILPILDFRRLLELPEQGIEAGSRVIAVEVGGMMFGILTDAVVGTIRVGGHELAPSPASLDASRQGLIAGVTHGLAGEMVAVFDLDAMARDPRIVVNEEAG